MADIVSEIIDSIQSDIDSGYYDPDTFDLYEAIWETLDNKLIYSDDIIGYWENTPGGLSVEIASLMTEEITEYVNGSISESDFRLPDNFTANRRAMRARPTNRRRPHSARHRANRRHATSDKTSMLSSEFFGMGWTNGHTGLVGHFVMYDNWLGAMVRAGTISGPKELEREFMASRARELENMSDIDWSQVDWDDVYDFLNGK